jgi:hypothetical protein
MRGPHPADWLVHMTVRTPTPVPAAATRPAGVVTAIGVLTALALLAFAAVNIALLAGTSLASGRYLHAAAQMPVTLAVENVVAAAIKIIGAAAALLAVAGRTPRVRPGVLAVVLWGAFATMAVYLAGSLGEAIGMIVRDEHIRALDVGYLLFFGALVTGFGVLAVSHRRRYPQPSRVLVLAVLAPPAVLGLLLLGIPALRGTVTGS